MRNGSLCSCQHIPGDDPNCPLHWLGAELAKLLNDPDDIPLASDHDDEWERRAEQDDIRYAGAI